MRVHSIIHAGHEGLGAIQNWIDIHEFSHTSTVIGNEDTFPTADSFDLLIIMGGPMSVNDGHSWINEEKMLILNAINSGKFVLGICLGAQMIASSLGAKITKNQHKEIGWWPVKKTMWLSSRIADYLPLHFTTCHWHGETFSIPEGAIKIMESEACSNQAFIYGDRTIAFQFHLEFTPVMLQEMLIHGKSDLVEAEFVQSADEINSKLHLCGENNLYLFRILDYFVCSYNKENRNR
jgi:GMP synthase-like glutamine amidotransferase